MFPDTRESWKHKSKPRKRNTGNWYDCFLVCEYLDCFRSAGILLLRLIHNFIFKTLYSTISITFSKGIAWGKVSGSFFLSGVGSFEWRREIWVPGEGGQTTACTGPPRVAWPTTGGSPGKESSCCGSPATGNTSCFTISSDQVNNICFSTMVYSILFLLLYVHLCTSYA